VGGEGGRVGGGGRGGEDLTLSTVANLRALH
jgi:hypothetical protein